MRVSDFVCQKRTLALDSILACSVSVFIGDQKDWRRLTFRGRERAEAASTEADLRLAAESAFWKAQLFLRSGTLYAPLLLD